MSALRARGRIAVLLFGVLALIAAACGDDGDSGGAADGAETSDPTGDETEGDDDASDEGDDTEADDTEGDDTEGDDTEGDDTDEPVELTASDIGVTESTIALGVVFPDLDVLGRDSGDVEAKWQTIIDRVNAEGGINGRTIEMHFRAPSPLEDTASDRVCTELTEDVEVFAAIGLFVRTTASCYAELHDTPFVSTFGVSDDMREGFSAAGLSLPGRSGRLVDARVEKLIEEGVLSEGMPVAVAGALEAQQGQDNYVAALEAAGVDVVAETVLTADGTDLLAVNAEMETFAEVWRSSGAEAVVASTALLSQSLLIGYNRTGLELPMLLPEGLAVNPSLLRDNQGLDLAPFEFAVSLSQVSQADQYTGGLNGVTECVDAFQEASGEEVALDESRNNLSPTIIACQTMDIFVAVATAAGPELTRESFAAAAEAFGPIEVTAIPEASIGPDKFDLTDSIGEIAEFNAETAQFEPVG